jgi:hypothetical protein
MLMPKNRKIDFFVKSNKLIRSLEKLSRKEMTRFREFIFSPYLNKHEEVRNLVDYLAEIYPRLDEKRCSKERLYQSVFGQGKYNEKLLAPVLSYAQRLLEEFWAFEAFREDEFSKQFVFLRELRTQQSFGAYERLYEKLNETAFHSPTLGLGANFTRFLLINEGDRYFNQFNNAAFESTFQQKQTQLDIFFLTEKLKDACETIVRQGVKKNERPPRLVEAVINEIQENQGDYQEIPSIITYFKVYKTLADNDPAIYHDALQEFRRWEGTFTREEKVTIYNYFRNYCLTRVNTGDGSFLAEVFYLYKSQLEQDLLLEDGFLLEWHYKNIVTAGLRLQENDWVLDFIETYRDKLAPEFRENAYKFNLASYHLTLKNYHEAMLLLQEVQYRDQRYNLGAKTLLLRTYYELSEFEPLFFLTESFRQFLTRNTTMTDLYRKGYLNLFRLTRKAAYLRSRLDYLPIEKARQELCRIQNAMQHAEEIFNRSWLEEKLRDLALEVG